VASLERDNSILFYHLMISASNIWPDKSSGPWWKEGPNERGVPNLSLNVK